ncbi:hypothetical protein [Haliangium sp.]|uniref:hypothetical protein n=1 Tax=Haliangium sp. TaxID=2663208 RepID=UPI003D11B60E
MSFTENMRKQFESDLTDLKKMRDEIRVKLHLASMEVKERWQQIEPKLDELERRIDAGSEEVVGATSKLFEDVGRAVRDMGERLLGKKDGGESP